MLSRLNTLEQKANGVGWGCSLALGLRRVVLVFLWPLGLGPPVSYSCCGSVPWTGKVTAEDCVGACCHPSLLSGPSLLLLASPFSSEEDVLGAVRRNELG